MPFDNTPSCVTTLFHLKTGRFVDLFVDLTTFLFFKDSKKFPKAKKNTENQRFRCFNMVDDIGLEPMTFRTSSGCSSQLS